MVAVLSSCDPSGPRAEGWAPTRQTGGPTVLWDAVAKPLPEIPLPNDAATRRDPASPTGRRLNISLDAPTELERSTGITVVRWDPRRPAPMTYEAAPAEGEPAASSSGS